MVTLFYDGDTFFNYRYHSIATEFLTRADFAGLVRLLTIEGMRVEKATEAMEFALKYGRPSVVDLVIESDPTALPFAGVFYTPGEHDISSKICGNGRHLWN